MDWSGYQEWINVVFLNGRSRIRHSRRNNNIVFALTFNEKCRVGLTWLVVGFGDNSPIYVNGRSYVEHFSFATMRLSPPELSFLYTSLTSDPPLRPDLRSLTQLRPLSVQTDVLSTANGSARVTWGAASPGQGGDILVVVKAQIEDAIQLSSGVYGGQISIDMFIPFGQN